MSKAKTSDKELSKKLRPFLDAVQCVQDLVAERDELRAKVKHLHNRNMHPHSREKSGLPCPRIEFELTPSIGQGWRDYQCVYWMVIPLRRLDQRAQVGKEFGALPEWYIPMGSTGVHTGSDAVPELGDLVVPYRDGSHAQWDREAFGMPDMPAYVRIGERTMHVELK